MTAPTTTPTSGTTSTTNRAQRPFAMVRTPKGSASPRAVSLRDLPRAEQARFAMALQRSRATAA